MISFNANIPLAPIVAQLTTANTNLDGTGTVVEIARGDTVKRLISRMTVRAYSGTTAGRVRFFVSTDGGTTKRHIHELTVTDATPSATASTFYSLVPFFQGMVLYDSNHRLYACPTKSEFFAVVTELVGITE